MNKRALVFRFFERRHSLRGLLTFSWFSDRFLLFVFAFFLPIKYGDGFVSTLHLAFNI